MSGNNKWLVSVSQQAASLVRRGRSGGKGKTNSKNNPTLQVTEDSRMSKTGEPLMKFKGPTGSFTIEPGEGDSDENLLPTFEEILKAITLAAPNETSCLDGKRRASESRRLSSNYVSEREERGSRLQSTQKSDVHFDSEIAPDKIHVHCRTTSVTAPKSSWWFSGLIEKDGVGETGGTSATAGRGRVANG